MLIATNLILSVPEIILLLFGAIILGITIHFFITSRRSLKATTKELEQDKGLAKDEWKMRYLNDMEIREQEIASLKKEVTKIRQQANEAEENVNIYTIESEEMRKLNQQLQAEMNIMSKQAVVATPPPPPQYIPRPIDQTDYLEQLRHTQSGLVAQNQQLGQLLESIDQLREKEEVNREMVRNNAELTAQLSSIQNELAEKDKEIQSIRQKETLTKEMTSMLDSAYGEFSVLQNKMQKLESQLTSSRMLNLEFEDLKEEHSRLQRDSEDHKQKLNSISNENQQLQIQVAETEDKLREANFQRQQLQKRISYLEELNNDLHVVADANKKLEGQLKRMGELESMINVDKARDQEEK